MDVYTILSTMTVADFKRFKKAVKVLQRSGMPTSQAVDILIGHMTEIGRYREAVTRFAK
jgi:tryptophan 2,3-dioxygenase